MTKPRPSIVFAWVLIVAVAALFWYVVFVNI